MKNVKQWFVALLAMFLIGFTSVAQASPDGVVTSIRNSVLSAARNAPNGLSGAQINSLVSRSIAPHVDFRAAASVACGQYWYQATSAQQNRITSEFRQLLIRSYSRALGKVNSRTTMSVGSPTYNSNGTISVPATIVNNGSSTPLIFGLTSSNKIFDVRFAGIWLISSSFHTQFTSIIQRNGINGLIANLAKKNGH